MPPARVSAPAKLNQQGGRTAGADVRRHAWQWAVANRTAERALPSGKPSLLGTVGMNDGAGPSSPVALRVTSPTPLAARTISNRYGSVRSAAWSWGRATVRTGAFVRPDRAADLRLVQRKSRHPAGRIRSVLVALDPPACPVARAPN